jgi:hypothetical protein
MVQANQVSSPVVSSQKIRRSRLALAGRKGLGVLLIAVVLSAIGCTPKFEGFTKVPPGQATIYFYRLPKILIGAGAQSIVKVNDVEGVVAITNGGWFDYVIPPGHYVIYDRPGYVFFKEYTKKATVDLKAGEICCLRFQGKSFSDQMADMTSGFEVVVVPPEQAEKEMRGLRKFKHAGGVKMALE